MSAPSPDGEPDLELAAGLAADELRPQIMDDADVHTTGWVVVGRSELQIGTKEKIEAGGCYRNVVLGKRLAVRIARRERERAAE